MLITVLSIDLHIPEAQSLKDKRMVLKSIKEKLRNKFNASVTEVDGHDKWQAATLGIAMIGTEQRFLDSCAQNVANYVEGFRSVEVCDCQVDHF